MAETLLTPSSIKLFGRVVTSLSFTNDTVPFGGNYFLQRQLAANVDFGISGTTYGTATTNAYTITNIAPSTSFPNLTVGMTVSEVGDPVHIAPRTVITSVNIADTSISIYPAAIAAATGVQMNVSISPKLARIYAFSFEGQYYAVPRPPLFLVHGSGIPVGNWAGPSTMDQAGVAGREWDFSGNWDQTSGVKPGPSDLNYWEYEKGDFSLRLDPEAGPFEQILLPLVLRSGADRSDRSGAGVSGAGVSGAGVSGAGVSGAGVSGAGVSGAGVRR